MEMENIAGETNQTEHSLNMAVEEISTEEVVRG
jgi:hypothetical protein